MVPIHVYQNYYPTFLTWPETVYQLDSHIISHFHTVLKFFSQGERFLLRWSLLIQNLELNILKSQKLEQLIWSKAHIHRMCNDATLTKRLGTSDYRVFFKIFMFKTEAKQVEYSLLLILFCEPSQLHLIEKCLNGEK